MGKPFYAQEADVAIQAAAVKAREWATYLRQHCTAFLRRENGAIAVEFALLVPLLAIGLLLLGFTAVRVHRWINVEQIVRAGAEAAIRDLGQTEALASMQVAAAAKGYTLWTGTTPPIPPNQLFLRASRNCSCPDTLHIIAPNCSVSCSGGRPAIVRYTVGATFKSSFDWDFQDRLIRLFVPTGAFDLILEKVVLVR